MYRNTHLKQERGAQIEAIRAEVFQTYASTQATESDLMANAMKAAATSLGGVGGLGPSTSNPAADPSLDNEEEEDDTVPEAPKEAADLSLMKSSTTSASQSGRDPSVSPPDAEEGQTSTSNSNPIIETGVGAAARGLGGVGGLGKTSSEPEEEAGSSSQNSSTDLTNDPAVQTAIGAAAMGLGGVGGLGRSSSEPSMPPAEEDIGSSGRVLPMGRIAATPAQVSRALKVHPHISNLNSKL